MTAGVRLDTGKATLKQRYRGANSSEYDQLAGESRQSDDLV